MDSMPVSTIVRSQKKWKRKESGTEIGSSLEFDFARPTSAPVE